MIWIFRRDIINNDPIFTEDVNVQWVDELKVIRSTNYCNDSLSVLYCMFKHLNLNISHFKFDVIFRKER